VETYNLLENYSPNYIIYTDINMTDSRHMCFDIGFRRKCIVCIYEISEHVHSRKRGVEEVYNLSDGRGYVSEGKFKVQISYETLD
jgi:hypothetical protein